MSTDSDLSLCCNRVLKDLPSFIAVDTEFIRYKSCYYPKISLIQIFYSSFAFIVDMLSGQLTNLEPLRLVMSSVDIIKVFHDCKQDLAGIYYALNVRVGPIADTQIAAMFCYSYNSKISYSNLVLEVTGVQLDKNHKRTDWSRRPLTENQLFYAISDVSFLYKIYPCLMNLLLLLERREWFIEEMRVICSVDSAYSINNSLHKNLRIMRELWASQKNVTKEKIFSDYEISRICEELPECHSSLKDILQKKNIDKYLSEIMKIINSSKSVKHRNHDISMALLLTLMLELKCRKANISRLLVASRDEIKYLLSGLESKIEFGWRKDFIGNDMLFCLENEKSKLSFNLERGCLSSFEVRTL